MSDATGVDEMVEKARELRRSRDAAHRALREIVEYAEKHGPRNGCAQAMANIARTSLGEPGFAL